MPVVDRNTCLLIVGACQKVLERAGCTVQASESENGATLVVTLPEISDIHAARLEQAIASTT